MYMVIGICKINSSKRSVELQRGPLSQGLGFKNSDAFEHSPQSPCYAPELVNSVYTKEDIPALYDHQESIARKSNR